VATASSEKRGFFQSPRNQRLLLRAAIVVVVAGVATALIVFFRNTGDATETFSNEPAQTFTPPKLAKVDPDARRVAGRFILTAVGRKNLAASFDLVHPELRQGFTRAQWESGNIPVVYYPTADLDFVSFKVDHSFEDELVLTVLLVPPAKEKGLKPASFYIGLKRLGGKDGPWKVYYWAPNYKPAVPDPG
jgi:hypothetical protein